MRGRLSLSGQTLFLLGFFGLFLVAPVAHTLIGAFTAGTSPLSLFALLFRNPVYLASLKGSFFIALAASLLSAALALPFAFFIVRHDFFGKAWLQRSMMLPMLLPPFAGAIAVKQLLGRQGALNLALQDLGLITAPIDWLGSGAMGVIVLEALHLFPVLYFSVVGVLASFNAEGEEAALLFGGRNWRFYRTVLFPALRPGLLSGLSMVFIWAFSDLGTPLLLEYRQVLPYQVFTMVTDVESNPMGYCLALVMALVGLLGFWASLRFSKSRTLALGRAARPVIARRLPSPARFLVPLALHLVFFLSVLPLFALLALSLSGSWFMTILPADWTWDHFGALWDHRITRASIQTSLFLSSLACALALALGFWVVQVARRSAPPVRLLLESLSMLPLALPGILIAFGYVGLFAGTPVDPARNPLFLLVLAYAVRRLPFAVRSLSSGYETLPKGFDEAAMTLGDGFWGRVWRLHLPLLSPFLLGAGILVFAFSMLEVSDSLILAMEEFHYPLTKAMFFLTTRTGDGGNVAAALGMVGVVLLGVSLYFANRLLGEKLGRMFGGS